MQICVVIYWVNGWLENSRIPWRTIRRGRQRCLWPSYIYNVAKTDFSQTRTLNSCALFQQIVSDRTTYLHLIRQFTSSKLNCLVNISLLNIRHWSTRVWTRRWLLLVGKCPDSIPVLRRPLFYQKPNSLLVQLRCLIFWVLGEHRCKASLCGSKFEIAIGLDPRFKGR